MLLQALGDAYIYVPNSIGLALSLAQLFLACFYPSRQRHSSAATHHNSMHTQGVGAGPQGKLGA